MGGLALGSWLLGHWGDRRENPLVAYGALELGVGLYALAVPTLFAALRPAYIALHGIDAPYAVLALGRALLAAAVLLPPTTLMGGTFPILVRYFVQWRGEIGLATGLLYFINTAGALAGCIAAGFFMIERFGLVGTTRIAATASLGAGVGALLLARTIGRSARRAAGDDAEPVAAGVSPGAARLAFYAIGLSGFASLAYEVLWTRALLRYLYNSTYAFTTMLATFLAGLAVGSAIHAGLLRRSRRPLLVFGLLELLTAAGFAASTYLFSDLMGTSAAILGGNVVHSFRESVVAMFLRAALVLFVPAVFLGATVPLATEICTRRLETLGGSVGRVYAINTLGAILGSLGAGFVLIPWLGMQGTVRLLVALNLGLGLALVVAEPAPAGRRTALAVGALAVAVFVQLAMPADVFRRTFHPQAQKLIFYSEGVTDTVAVAESWGMRAIIYDDQRGTAGTGSYQWNFLLGHLPLLLHNGEPRTVLHICFGVGNSLSAVAAHESVERVDNVELSPHVLEAARYFWTNNEIIANPKVHTIIDDGRNFVMATRNKYDVILMEPPEVFTAGVINLFTREFYQETAARLTDDGLMMQWIPFGEATLDQERMLFRAFYDVYPNATAWRLLDSGPLLFIGGRHPLRVDYQKLKARMQEDRVRQDLELIGVRDVDHLLSFFIFDSNAFRDFAAPAAPVTDDRTVLDFAMPRFLGSGFGFGTFTDKAQANGVGPFAAIGERSRFYSSHRSRIVPLLDDLGGEDPQAIQTRVDERAKIVVKITPINEPEWRRWGQTAAR
jgi:spermidine synthase